MTSGAVARACVTGGPARPLLVGENNLHRAEPRWALAPVPAHLSGGRLAAILGLSAKEYLRLFSRVNLCAGDVWDQAEARESAQALGSGQFKVLILLGVKVRRSFGFGVGTRDFEVLRGATSTWVFLPHPSGRCFRWNDPGAAGLARAAVASARVRLPRVEGGREVSLVSPG